MDVLKRGDVVVSEERDARFEQFGVDYGSVVVVQSRPLVLVSQDASARWEWPHVPRTLRVIGRASPTLVAGCLGRL